MGWRCKEEQHLYCDDFSSLGAAVHFNSSAFERETNLCGQRADMSDHALSLSFSRGAGFEPFCCPNSCGSQCVWDATLSQGLQRSTTARVCACTEHCITSS